MREMRMRPKDNYLHTATWEELVVLTGHWKSDLDFYRDEIRFLNDLIGKYFIWLTKEDSIARVQEMTKRLIRLEKQQEDLSSRAAKHILDFELLMENAFSQDETWIREEHIKLEEDIASFVKDFRNLKKDLFGITEHIIESEKLQHLLT